jgi:hypothetical protein
VEFTGSSSLAVLVGSGSAATAAQCDREVAARATPSRAGYWAPRLGEGSCAPRLVRLAVERRLWEQSGARRVEVISFINGQADK